MLNKVIFILCEIVMVLFVAFQNIYAAINPDFTPKWQVGESWKMVVREMPIAVSPASIEEVSEGPGKVMHIHFQVIDLKEIDGEMCYVVEITYRNPTCEYERDCLLQLYVRKDDFTLKKVIDNFTIEYSNGHDFVIFLDPFCIAIPCDFPNFPSTNTNEQRSIEHPIFGLMTQKVTFIDDNTVEIELSTVNNNGLLKTVQIWEKGKLWWSSVERTFTYKDVTKPGHPEVTKVEYDNILEGTDTTPPQLSVSVSPSTLWPPDHQMVEITPTITVSDDYDRFPEVKLESVTSNEPDDATGDGDGHTTGDIQISQVWDTKQHKNVDKILLRAERTGEGNGRIYTITYTATDFSGNSSTATATVTVPHDVGE